MDTRCCEVLCSRKVMNHWIVGRMKKFGGKAVGLNEQCAHFITLSKKKSDKCHKVFGLPGRVLLHHVMIIDNWSGVILLVAADWNGMVSISGLFMHYPQSENYFTLSSFQSLNNTK